MHIRCTSDAHQMHFRCTSDAHQMHQMRLRYHASESMMPSDAPQIRTQMRSDAIRCMIRCSRRSEGRPLTSFTSFPAMVREQKLVKKAPVSTSFRPVSHQFPYKFPTSFPPVHETSFHQFHQHLSLSPPQYMLVMYES